MGWVLVTGATGVIGPLLVQALLDKGQQVRVLCRQAPATDLFPPDVDVFLGDVTDAQCVQQAMADVDMIYHLAAKLHVVNPDPALYDAYWQVNYQGTKHIVDAGLTHNVERIVFFSTIAVYGATGQQPVDENTLPQPDTIYGKTKLAAEKLVLDATNAQGESIGVVLRVAAVYGQCMKGNYPRLIKLLKRGVCPLIDGGRNQRTLIYDQDVVAGALLAGEHKNSAGKIFNLTDGDIHSLAAIINTMRASLKQHALIVSIPLWFVQLVVHFVEKGTRLFGRRLALQSTVDKFMENVVVNGYRIQQELGFQPQYNLERGWQKTLAHHRND